MNELQHLQLVFPEKPLAELRQTLMLHNMSVEEAVEAILNKEEKVSQWHRAVNASPSQRSTRTQTLPSGQQQQSHGSSSGERPNSHTIAVLPPISTKPTVANIPPAGKCDSMRNSQLSTKPTLVDIPPEKSKDNTIIRFRDSKTTNKPTIEGQRRRSLLQSRQLAAVEQEENELEKALKNSMNPSDRGLDFVSDEELSRIMNDPDFLASLDDRVQSQPRNEKQEGGASHLISPTLPSLKQVATGFVRARSKLGIATGQEEELLQKLEQINRENEEESLRRNIRLQAKNRMMEAVKEHLESVSKIGLFRLSKRNSEMNQWSISLLSSISTQHMPFTLLIFFVVCSLIHRHTMNTQFACTCTIPVSFYSNTLPDRTKCG